MGRLMSKELGVDPDASRKWRCQKMRRKLRKRRAKKARAKKAAKVVRKRAVETRHNVACLVVQTLQFPRSLFFQVCVVFLFFKYTVLDISTCMTDGSHRLF